MKLRKVILLVGFLLVLVVVFVMVRFSVNKTREIKLENECKVRGGIWECGRATGMIATNEVFCNCMKHFDDGGKTCMKGSDCKAGVCVAFIGVTPGKDGLYRGKCLASLHPGEEGSNYQPYCQQAIIENGIIIKRADCKY